MRSLWWYASLDSLPLKVCGSVPSLGRYLYRVTILHSSWDQECNNCNITTTQSYYPPLGMQNITQTTGELSIIHRSVQQLLYTTSHSGGWLVGWWVVTTLHPNNPTRFSSTLAVRFFYCLWSLNHPQRDFPSNTDTATGRWQQHHCILYLVQIIAPAVVPTFMWNGYINIQKENW